MVVETEHPILRMSMMETLTNCYHNTKYGIGYLDKGKKNLEQNQKDKQNIE